MRAVAAGLSDVGLQREHNEDSFVVLKEYDLFVVADGMGGHRAGDVASQASPPRRSREFFRTTANEDVTWPFHFDTNLIEEENRLLTGIRVANRQIFERSHPLARVPRHGHDGRRRHVQPARSSRMYIGHVGDSRCYRVRERADPAADARPLAHQRLPARDARPHRGAEERAAQERHHPRARDAGPGRRRSAARRPAAAATSTSSARTASRGMVSDDEIQQIVASTDDIREACRSLIAARQRARRRGQHHGGPHQDRGRRSRPMPTRHASPAPTRRSAAADAGDPTRGHAARRTDGRLGDPTLRTLRAIDVAERRALTGGPQRRLSRAAPHGQGDLHGPRRASASTSWRRCRTAGIAVLMGIESACIPLPSELIMPYAGALSDPGGRRRARARSSRGHAPGLQPVPRRHRRAPSGATSGASSPTGSAPRAAARPSRSTAATCSSRSTSSRSPTAGSRSAATSSSSSRASSRSSARSSPSRPASRG